MKMKTTLASTVLLTIYQLASSTPLVSEYGPTINCKAELMTGKFSSDMGKYETVLDSIDGSSVSGKMLGVNRPEFMGACVGTNKVIKIS